MPKLLDLYCGAGGAARGYFESGFDQIIGVDNKPQPRYPYKFVQADAVDYLNQIDLTDFDLIHASPPCQHYSFGSKRWDTDHLDLISLTRQAILCRDIHYVIENVVGSPLIDPIQLNGLMFGLKVIRRRNFETNWPLTQLPKVKNKKRVNKGELSTVAGHGGNGPRNLFTWKLAMGISWMNEEEIIQAIPPAYTHYIGLQFLEYYACHQL
jgi:DNA (cytosine-5)-methyltransferase 1